MDLDLDVDQLFGSWGESSPLMMLVWIIPIVLFVFYGQRIQLMVTSNEIKKSITKLGAYRTESRDELVGFVRERFSPGSDPAKRLGVFIDYFSVMPVDLDPAGIVQKIQHTVRSRDEHTRAQIKSLHPGMGEQDLSQVQTLLEIASTLQLLYKVINHLFLTAKKQNNFPLILPLQMMLPFIMEQAEALRDAVPAFRAGQPVGDGIGPMVVGKMMLGAEKKEAAFQTVWCESEYEGRKLFLLKAKGPMSTVGRMGDAVEGIASGRKLDAIIMVDAALKLEGEDSATVARGFGAAIGGIGTERFQIEELAAKHDIPVLAIVVRQSVREAVGLMTEGIAATARDVRAQVCEMITENTARGQSVLLIGVGNTLGVGQ